ncbi:MAG TPA: ABC transporter ATP-binding protein [Micromonosporaceae bacterium]|nr:ABC transporter ATP-binding protein [Micromonosporaceae bacterium]
MNLFRDLWAASPRRAAFMVTLLALGAAGQATAAGLAGPVLLYRSRLLFAMLALALVVGVVGDLVVGLLAARLTADWSAAVRRQLCRVALGQDLPTLEATPVGELLDRIDGDVYQVASEVRGAGVRIAQSVAIGALSACIAVAVWWPAGVAMLAIAVVLIVRLRRPTQAITPARMAEEEAWSDLAAVMEESIHGQDDVRTSLARPYVLRLYARRASVVLERGRRVWTSSAWVTVVASVVTRGGVAAIVIGGAWALADGRVNGARLTAVWLLALAFAGTVEHVSRMVPELQYALGAWGRVQLLRASPQERADGDVPTDGDLAVRDLTFRYGTRGVDDDRPPALRDITLRFARGRSYAVIGRTGSGKSTLAKVLTRAVDVPPGTVYLAGADVLDLDVEQLRRWVAVVPQRTDILAGTLAENIALFDPDLIDRAGPALDELGLGGWVADLPDGLRTRLGDGGHALSAGQEQLVAFARILVRDPHVVILDEATARLDPVTEMRVQKATERLLRDRIGIVIAHRLSSVQRCDEVVVLADGELLEAGPLVESRRFADLLARSNAPVAVTAGGGVADGVGIDGSSGTTTAVDVGGGESVDAAGPDAVTATGDGDGVGVAGPDTGGDSVADGVLPRDRAATMTPPARTEPPTLPAPPQPKTLLEIVRLSANDPRYGLAAVGLFLVLVVLGLDGAALPWLWAHLVDGTGGLLWPAVGIVAALACTAPIPYYTSRLFPEWWVRQMLRISLRLVHGQTGPRRISAHTPAEVIAQGGDTERVVILADNVVDQAACVVTLIAMTVISGSFVPALFFAGTMVLSGLAATLFGPGLAASARRTVAARAAFATALVSSLSAARTVKLAGATRPVLAHLARLDRERSDRQRREISIQVWARSTPSILSGVLPIGAWGLFLDGRLSSAATLVAVSTLGAARWFAWTTASLISQLPSARVWTRRTATMAGIAHYSGNVPGVDISAGTAPTPEPAPRHPLQRLELSRFSAVHEDGTVAAADIDLTVERGELVLVVGPVGAGKSSFLRALAGIVHHTGALRWNGVAVTEPEMFLRPNQVGYVAQLPRVFSGSLADNIRLGHDVEALTAASTAQLDHDLAAAGSGLSLLIGHKGTRLSGGQLQRVALARALAPRTELLIADDVSSALDVTTELALWDALRTNGLTVIGSTSKRAALNQADKVLVLTSGRSVAYGTWRELEARWGHLAG